MTDLSPATLTVWQRYCGIVEEHGPARLGLAAALRAAAEQLHHDPGQSHQVGGIITSRLQLLAIAAELEGNHD